MTPNWILDQNEAKQTKTSYWKKKNKNPPAIRDTIGKFEYGLVLDDATVLLSVLSMTTIQWLCRRMSLFLEDI